ncbi:MULTISPECIES: hypothetical protein [unclassified Imperialibacter]|uniref:hypothetical protein n=1 Tax=unclassified Imperialibacter TaxID=2629706 RepID=UPI00125B989F|nr:MULTISPECIES: hypothetical protein [unclassified Imperialibacter]CAD5252766.1 hypothetical protein IMPERIA75_190017 [Imperialibacter sp. 75]CAD5280976.1 hypothetical protein IMPERIA89_480017 [Imperialibacter sp. 89]VVT28865.1 hypothetical protein IMPR6_470017 [Imperialibacter sp. EC-SDR9]
MKRKLSLCIVSALGILCFSCERESEGLSLLTIMVEENAINEGQERWVYISEPSGKVLDSHKCKNGEVFELKGPVALEAIDVTVFIPSSSGSGVASAVTYLGVISGRTWTLKAQSQSEAPEVIGTATIEIVNYHESMPPDESIKFSPGASGWPLNDRSVTEAGLLATVNMYKDPQELLMTGFRGGQRVYLKVAAMVPNENLVIDFDSFQEYDQIIEVPAEFNEDGRTIGFYGDGRGYLLSDAYDSYLYGTETSLGYIQGFDSYSTKFNEFYGPSFITYYKLGEPALNVEFPSFTLSIVDRTTNGFSFDASFDYTYKSTQWLYSSADGQTGMSWTVYGDAAANVRIPAVANIVYEKESGLKIDDFSIYELNCIQRLDGLSYTGFVSNTFENKSSAEYEYFIFGSH